MKALHVACTIGNLSKVKELVERGHDIHCVYPQSGDYPHEIACRFDHLDILKYLVSKGADITTDDNWAINIAVSEGHFEIVKYLVENGAPLKDGRRVLAARAAELDHVDILKYLIVHGVDIVEADNLAINAALTYSKMDSAAVLIDFVIREMKKYTLLMLLNRSPGTGVIHKDLLKSTVDAKHIDHYKYYQKKSIYRK